MLSETYLCGQANYFGQNKKENNKLGLSWAKLGQAKASWNYFYRLVLASMYANFASLKLFRSVVGGGRSVVGNTLKLKPASYAELGNKYSQRRN